jgi:hypothetical protein
MLYFLKLITLSRKSIHRVPVLLFTFYLLCVISNFQSQHLLIITIEIIFIYFQEA